MALSRIVESRAVAMALPGLAARPSSWLRLALRTGANARSRDWNVLTLRNRTAAWGDLPDADGFGFLALNGGFRTDNRSLNGRDRVISRWN
jgi:hypothetical protein